LREHLLMGGSRFLNEALNQAFKLEAAKAAAGPPVRSKDKSPYGNMVTTS
jgi:hypothetical protein